MTFLEKRIPPLALWVLVLFGMYITEPFFPKLAITPIVTTVMACLFFLVGALIALAGVLEFRKQKTTVDPRDPEKTTSLVDSGIYQYTRNPMYVGFAFALFAVVNYWQSPVLIVWIVFFVIYLNRFQIIPEERAMESHFGETYRMYKRRVRRWL